MLQARRPSSLKLYSTYVTKWKCYCFKHKLNYLTAPVSAGLSFLQLLRSSGIGYSALNTARSALSSILQLPDGQQFGNHSDVKLFLKGAFNAKPPKPRYISAWDPADVLKLLQTWSPADNLSLEKLAMKTAMLILLVTGQRPQLLSKLKLDNMKLSNAAIKFALEALDIKQGRPGFMPQSIVLKPFVDNKKLCVHHYLSIYLKRTILLRKEILSVFLTSTKPYRAASSNTLSRWLKKVLELTGIDTKHFSAGSARAASTSKAKELGLPVDKILQAGGWVRETTFTKFYNRKVISLSFANTVLSQVAD
jgi:integrase